ncbi:MAG: adenylosuccinate lyase [Acidobacteriota bacterium]
MTSSDPHAVYQNPLIARYASAGMAELFSDQVKFGTWRRIWLALAEAQQQLGLPIEDGQLQAMREHLDDIDFEVAAEEEKKRRHDVMAHVHAFGVAAPEAKAILHLGATSAFVGDNADIILLRRALRRTCVRTHALLEALAAFADEHRELACLGATHLQPAQPTTVGKRACLWAQDVLMDLEEMSRLAEELPLRGCKGTTGTQASFLELFDGDHDQVRSLERKVADALGFEKVVPVTGQTYPRKLDSQVLASLAGLAESAGKLASDVRILQAFGELAEPMGKKQTGSSAMAYKRNPMRSERTCALARFLISQADGIRQVAANQWLERTLDDSAQRRLALPQAFLAADAILILLTDVVSGLDVFPKVIAKRLAQELPYLSTEVILMEAVKEGGDRQDLHERIREHARACAEQQRVEGLDNDLLERLAGDESFASVKDRLDDLVDPRRCLGRAPEQVGEFLDETLRPALKRHEERAKTWGDDGVSTTESLRV